MTTIDHAPWPSPTGVGAALDDVLCSVEPHRPRPPLRYLRRKPGRGLVAVYGTAKAPGDMYTVDRGRVRGGKRPRRAGPDAAPSGAGRDPRAGRGPAAGPDHPAVPPRRAAPRPGRRRDAVRAPQLREALEPAATEVLGDSPGTLRLLSADAVPCGTSRVTGACSATGSGCSATASATGAERPARGRRRSASCTGSRRRRTPQPSSWPGCAVRRAAAVDRAAARRGRRRCRWR